MGKVLSRRRTHDGHRVGGHAHGRKEFFAAKLEDIKRVILANYDGSVEFAEVPDANQWPKPFVQQLGCMIVNHDTHGISLTFGIL